MRFKRNDSGLPDAELRKILVCAARGVRDVGITVEVRQDRTPTVLVGGRGHPGGLRCSESLIIICREPGENPLNADSPLFARAWVARRFPGLLVETLQDQIVWLAAKGFYRLKQRRRVGPMDDQLSEFRCLANNARERFAFRRLNAWRVATARQSVPETRGAHNGGLVAYNRERQLQAQKRVLTRRVAASPYTIGRFVMLGGTV